MNQIDKLTGLVMMAFGLALQVFALFDAFAAGISLSAFGALLLWAADGSKGS